MQSFDWRTLGVVHQFAPDMRTAYMTCAPPVDSIKCLTGNNTDLNRGYYRCS